MHWFTPDPHHSREKIIGFCDRSFPNVAAMNSHLLSEWRARVGPDDDLWILRDFTAGRSSEAQRREVRGTFHALPGHKHLIRGNHDEDRVCDPPWDSLAETADIVVNKRRLFLYHSLSDDHLARRTTPRAAAVRPCPPEPAGQP